MTENSYEISPNNTGEYMFRCFNISSYKHMKLLFGEIESIVSSSLTTIVQGLIMKIKKGGSDMCKPKCKAILLQVCQQLPQAHSSQPIREDLDVIHIENLDPYFLQNIHNT